MNKLLQTLRAAPDRLRRRVLKVQQNRSGPLYGRNALGMVGLYLLCLVGVPLATFLVFMFG